MWRDSPSNNQERSPHFSAIRVSKRLRNYAEVNQQPDSLSSTKPLLITQMFCFDACDRQAYIEFASKESSMKAKHLNESLFKGRQLTVEPKRKNIRGMSRG